MPAPALHAVSEAHNFPHHPPNVSVPVLHSLSSPALHALQETNDSADTIHRLGAHASSPSRLLSSFQPISGSAPLSATAQKALRNYTPPNTAPLPSSNNHVGYSVLPSALLSSSSSSSPSRPDDHAVHLSKQLSYLRWRRAAVESSIRSLVDGRRRQEDAVAVKTIAKASGLGRVGTAGGTGAGTGTGGLTPIRLAGDRKAQWTAAVVLDELSKPLEVSRRFVEDFEESDKRVRLREEVTVERHLKSVGDIMKKIKDREKKERRTGKKGGNNASGNDDLKARVDGLEQILLEKKLLSRDLARYQV